tara:strand:+ start:5289 stop:5834 length:546 start_codon:yes stop_codon:yes gene_type:complete
MEAIQTKIDGCWLIKPKVYEDPRGYFYESFQKERFEQATQLSFNPIQDNETYSTYGVIRGLHFQKEPFAQAKLVRALRGTILDVAVDLRKDSRTYGAVVTFELSQKNKEQLFVPKGCAHGYAVLSSDAVVFYKTDAYYHPEFEGGILYNDPELNIDWRITEKDQILSEKDTLWRDLKNSFL